MSGPLRLPGPVRRAGLVSHRWWALPLVAALGLTATGCQSEVRGAEAGRPVTLVVSETWVKNHQGGGGGGASAGEVQARLRSLQEGVDRLREETHTGWMGRQDDVTGYLGELAGGSWPGSAAAFADNYGADLFGVTGSVLRFEEPDTETVPTVTSTRATQAVGEVPVLDAVLVFTGRDGGGGERLTGVRGRVFPGLAVDTTPTLSPEQAASAAAEASGATAGGTPRLVVLPNQTGVLAWEVAVVGQATAGLGAGLYYVDATTGDLLDVRPASAEAASPVLSRASAQSHAGHAARVGRTPPSHRSAEPEPNTVELSGTDPRGRPITAFGLQTEQGVELVDTTTLSWNAATRTGGVSTFDGTGLSYDGLPGQLVVSDTTQVDDADAIAAQNYSHAVLDFYEELGRDSWDNKDGDLVGVVHFNGPDYCNAEFLGQATPPAMVYGGPCVLDGTQLSATFVDPDIAAHEITHGVTATSAGLLYSGQSGALNESFSDYFGNVIGSRIHGADDNTYGEDNCAGISAPSYICPTNPEGSMSERYLLNGATFDDYLRILDPGLRPTYIYGGNPQDWGGVHYNSAIWNNALWSIRTRLVQIDGEPGTTSALAHSFDRAVYGALTRLTPTSGYFDARAAVEQVIIDSGLDPVVLRVAREVFDQNKICAGCPDNIELAGDVVTSASQTQEHPEISGDRVAWLDLSGVDQLFGYAASAGVDGSSPSLSAASDVADVAFAGEAILTLGASGTVARTVGSETETLDALSKNEDFLAALVAGLGGSEDGGAWLSTGGTVKYVDAAGRVSEAEVGGTGSDPIAALAAGGGTVAVGTTKGRILIWTPGSGGFRQVGSVPARVFDLATYGGNVLVVDKAFHSTLIRADGTQITVTKNAFPFGAAMSAEYAVWSESVGSLRTAVIPSTDQGYDETDVYLLSLATGKIYDITPVSGQQGFPSISGRRLVWQDAAFGGDDILTVEVPGGL
jgi:hypothetical protein